MPITIPLLRRPTLTPARPRPVGGAPSPLDLHGGQGQQGSAVRGVLAANLLIIANTVLRACATLIIMPLMVATLGHQLYGLWITISTVTMYFSLSDSGLGQTVVNKIGQAHTLGQRERIGEIMATAHVLYWLLVLTVGFFAVTLILTLPLGDLLLSETDAHLEPLLRVCLVLSTVLALARIPMLVFPGLLIGVRKLPLRVGWEIFGTLFTLAATAITLLSGAGLVSVTIVVNISLLVSTTAICLSSSRCGAWARLCLSQFKPALLHPLAMNSSFFFLINAASLLDRSLATLLVPHFASLAAAPPFFLLTSVFRVAAFSFITALPRAVQPFVVMWASNGDTARLASAAKLLTKGTTILASLMIVLFAPFAEPFVEIWLGADCYPGNAVLALIAGAFLVDSLFCTPVYFLIAMNRQRILSLLMLAKAVLTAALAITFAQRFANPLVGLAAGAFAASALTGFGVLCLTRAALDFDWKVYSVQFLARPLAYAAIISVLVMLTTSTLTMATKPVATVALAIFGAWGGWRMVFDSDDRAVVRQALLRLRPNSRARTTTEG